MLTVWDYLVIVFYMVFMLAIGGICKHLSKDSSRLKTASWAAPVSRRVAPG